MEGVYHIASAIITEGLNPCFVGGWSWRLLKRTKRNIVGEVLILVLLEDGLGGKRIREKLHRCYKS